ncbi:MAG TPA: prepilin-type N-terminal cleavage/methylation domain-containing protein [Smithellaceae bacterium]|nr:prepilin-type N-terminal cleavage/methylation domain-containing protein [Smithellaceae bacterium]
MGEYYCKEKYSLTELRIFGGAGGFSLVELIVAMVAGLIIIGAAYSIFLGQERTMSKQDKIVEMQQNVRAAMDMLSREVMMAGYAKSNGIPYSSSQLQIMADLNEDGDVTDAHENIIYTYDAGGKRINRNTGGGAQPFAENITAFTFQYLDENGSGTTTTDDIRGVRLTITGRTSAPVNGQYPAYTLRADVYARNLAYLQY